MVQQVSTAHYVPNKEILTTLLSYGSAGSDADGSSTHNNNNSNTDYLSLIIKPLRTVMNYQYRYGTTTTQAIKTLYMDGGWTRYYQGLTAALFQGPISRFGDTAANVGILALLESNSYMKNLPSLVKTVFASVAAASFRMILTPIDTVKTTLQTQGKEGMKILRERVCEKIIDYYFYKLNSLVL